MASLKIRRLNVGQNDEQKSGAVNFTLIDDDGKRSNGVVSVNGPLTAGILALAPDAGDYELTVTKIPDTQAKAAAAPV